VAKCVTVIDGHPDPDKAHFCHALAEAYAQAATAAGHSVKRLTLGEIDVPILRSLQEWEQGKPTAAISGAQEAIAWAEHLVIIYPLWLGTMPALLKGFLEQVFRPGFAVAFELGKTWEKLLKGKSARVIVTMGMPASIYRWYFFAHSLKALERNILGFCGIGPIKETLIGGIGMINETKRQEWLETVRGLGRDAS
jgi:putative NADPH-quinone reductase